MQSCWFWPGLRKKQRVLHNTTSYYYEGGSVSEWLACWTQAQKARVQIAVATLSGNSFRQTVHTHCASVHQAAKLAAALLRVAKVTAGLVESNDSLPPGLWLTSPAGWLLTTGISSGTLRSVIKYGLPFYLLLRYGRREGTSSNAAIRPDICFNSKTVRLGPWLL